MTLDPALFVDYPDLTEGDRVRYQTARNGEQISGIGVVELIWLGIEEMCVVDHDGLKRSLCRALGDTIEKVGR